jgi:hypothetical protein
MVTPATSLALTELEQVQVLNEVIDDKNIGEFSLDNETVFDSDHTKLVTPGTNTGSGSESDNDGDEQEET